MKNFCFHIIDPLQIQSSKAKGLEKQFVALH
jgi:hypothetical protein